jgi:hypothetical protein
LEITSLAIDPDEFFRKSPKDTRYHIELRTESCWITPVFDFLKKHGVELVFSHWTWLPSSENSSPRWEWSLSTPDTKP